MKDLHSHLLPNIDDGSKSFLESITLLKNAANSGITDIVLTPHYITNSKYVCNNDEKSKLFFELKKKLDEENIKINIYLGNEIFIDENIIELIKNGEVATINNSRYLLVEMPLNIYQKNALDIIYELVRNGYIPILAHPERYKVFQKEPLLINDFINMGVLLQINYKSLLGCYGRSAKKLVKYLLKNHQVSFVGSDTHHDLDFKIDKFYKKIKRIIKDEEELDKILEKNFLQVINDCDII